jgi:two-component system phosphate regulon sensor histidine kinase PhoR
VHHKFQKNNIFHKFLGKTLKKDLYRILLFGSIFLILFAIGSYIFLDYAITVDFENIKENPNYLQSEIKNKIFIFITFILIIFFLFAYVFVKNIKVELQKIDKYLYKISKKKYGQFIDLTLSDEFRQIGEKLEFTIERLYKLNRKKRKYNAKLKLANYQQEKLLGAISHELKNPMSSIIGYSQILKEELGNMGIEETYIKFIDKIISNGKRSDELLNRLRLAVQLENNKFELKYEVFNLPNLITRIVLNQKKEWQNRNIEQKYSKYEIYADQVLIELVVTNLIENALKYSDGDVFVSIDKDHIRVQDFGIGIKDNDLSNVTKRFYRVDNNTHQQSMGLGLAIVSYILKLHNLTLQIESEVGKGSVFSVDLTPVKHKELPQQLETISTPL